MKVELDRSDIRAALEMYVERLCGGEWVCTAADYLLPHSIELEQDAPELRAEQEREAAELAKYTALSEASATLPAGAIENA